MAHEQCRDPRHGSGGAKGLAEADSLLGEVLPDHAAPTVTKALRVAVVWLALWLVPVMSTAAVTTVSRPSGSSRHAAEAGSFPPGQ